MGFNERDDGTVSRPGDLPEEDAARKERIDQWLEDVSMDPVILRTPVPGGAVSTVRLRSGAFETALLPDNTEDIDREEVFQGESDALAYHHRLVELVRPRIEIRSASSTGEGQDWDMRWSAGGIMEATDWERIGSAPTAFAVTAIRKAIDTLKERIR